MGWQKLVRATPPAGNPVLVRTADGGEPIIAFLGSDGFWYAGGALVQGSTTLLNKTPLEWCEPTGPDAL
jgi:hypothetical protein